MTQKNNNFLLKFKLLNKLNENWDLIFNFCINYFNQNNYSKNIVKVVRTIHSNKSFCLILFILASWFWSNLILNFFYCFMLIDSLVISLLILQNNCVEINSRRLAKNVILITLTTMNLIGGIMTLLLVSFVYMEYSKFIGRLIFKFIKFIIKIFGNIFPPIYLLYPDIKLFNFEDPDMTIVSNKNNKHINLIKPTSSDSDSYSDSSVQSEKKNKKKYKKHNKKIIKKKSKKNKLTSNNESTFPTISTIKYDIFKNNNLWTK
jgi:hypothetical protein